MATLQSEVHFASLLHPNTHRPLCIQFAYVNDNYVISLHVCKDYIIPLTQPHKINKKKKKLHLLIDILSEY